VTPPVDLEAGVSRRSPRQAKTGTFGAIRVATPVALFLRLVDAL